MPALKPPLIDRYIIAARKGNMEPVLIINKIELLSHPPKNIDAQSLIEEKILYDEITTTYRSLGIQVICVSTVTGEGLEELQAVMKNKASVFSGQSGVGKSSLINAVIGINLPTGDLMHKTSKGTHTTTSAQLLPLGGEGFCIDTPGIRSFGIWNLDQEEIEAYFTEIFDSGRNCRYPDCTHLHEPECAVQLAVDEGRISRLRFQSYCALVQSSGEKHYNR
jgi:ribosome biogenesis GTPase / thiamine phosphate phosphatase